MIFTFLGLDAEDSIGEKERWRLSIHNGGHQLQYQAGIRPSAGLVYFYILISYQDSQPPPPCVQPAITTLPLFFLFSTSEYSNSFPPMSPSSDFSNLSREYVPHCNLLQLEAALDIYDKWTKMEGLCFNSM